MGKNLIKSYTANQLLAYGRRSIAPTTGVSPYAGFVAPTNNLTIRQRHGHYGHRHHRHNDSTVLAQPTRHHRSHKHSQRKALGGGHRHHRTTAPVVVAPFMARGIVPPTNNLTIRQRHGHYGHRHHRHNDSAVLAQPTRHHRSHKHSQRKALEGGHGHHRSHRHSTSMTPYYGQNMSILSRFSLTLRNVFLGY